MARLPSDSLPLAWREAFARDQLPGKPLLADPLPERRVARLLAAFIATGRVGTDAPGSAHFRLSKFHTCFLDSPLLAVEQSILMPVNLPT